SPTENMNNTSEASQPAVITWGRALLHFLFGVCLSIFTLGFEIATRFSDDIYINPIPTKLHILAVGLVPAILAVNLFRCLSNTYKRPWDLHLNSLGLSLAMVYALLYLPIAPFALLGIIFYGIGFLPLAPLIVLFCLYRIRKELKAQQEPEFEAGWRHFNPGLAAGIGLLVLASTPQLLTDFAIAQYVRGDSEDKMRAVKQLRVFGSEDVLLSSCYRRAQPVFFWGGGDRLETSEARKLYYRVTGKSFNEKRKDRVQLGRMGGGNFDNDLGGEHVGQRVDSLHLQESRIDGILEPAFGTGYAEWTMVFRNDDWREQEARMLLSMPRGAVASRVTLWVNGQPREAAFGSKAKVRAAYEAVAVRQRRDPLLVNWAGPDLLLVQCFPIPRNGGEMKIRIGMSFPLEVDAQSKLTFRQPAIVAENFTIDDGFEHSLWYEELVDSEIVNHPLFECTHEELMREQFILNTGSEILPKRLNSAHPVLDRPQAFEIQLPARNPQQAPDAIAIDGSIGMRAQAKAISIWLSAQNATFDLYLASDGVKHFQGDGTAAAKWLRSQKFKGGQDNVPALVEAIRKSQAVASEENPQSIYWFSGPQPIQLSGTENIRQIFERRTAHIEITACISMRDYNALHELAPLNYCEALYLKSDGTLHRPMVQFEPTRAEVAAVEASSHPHRIWLAEEIREQAGRNYKQQAKLGASKFSTAIAEQAQRAAEAYLVTQLSGAVVLETDRQYEENDLEPGDPNHTPTVPEKKHFALIIGMLSLAWIVAGRRRLRTGIRLGASGF
ncbi:MAG: VIT domain-containing protein, partial [Opitutales bacterium]